MKNGIRTAVVAAIITTESGWDSRAESSAGALGLMQVTKIAQVDAIKHCGSKARGNLLDPRINVIAGTCYLDWLRSQGMTWEEAIITYNGGFRQLKNYRSNKPLAAETQAYWIKVTTLAHQYCPNHGWLFDDNRR